MTTTKKSVAPSAAPTIEVDSALVARYAAADKSDKATIRKSLQDAMLAAVDEMDVIGAATAKATLAACLATTAPAKVVVDYRNLVAQRIANLRAAADILEKGIVRPEGVPADADLTNLEKVEPIAEAVQKIAATKVTTRSVSDAPRRSISDLIASVFADVEPGTVLTVAEIVKRGTTPDYKPSSGAVANALRNLPADASVTVHEADANGPLRAER